jgi:hypothetical protein
MERVVLWTFVEVKNLEDHQVGFGKGEEYEGKERFLRDRALKAVFGKRVADLPLSFLEALNDPEDDCEAQQIAESLGFDIRTDRGAVLRDWLYYNAMIQACATAQTRPRSEIIDLATGRIAQRLERDAMHWSNTRGTGHHGKP